VVSIGVVAVVADEFDDAVAGAAGQFGSVVGTFVGSVSGASVRFALVGVFRFAVGPDVGVVDQVVGLGAGPDVGAGAGVWAGWLVGFGDGCDDAVASGVVQGEGWGSVSAGWGAGEGVPVGAGEGQ